MKTVTKFASVGLMTALLPINASALNFTVTEFAIGNLSGAQTDFNNSIPSGWAFALTEDFEGFDTVKQIGPDSSTTLGTDVGTFSTINGKTIDGVDYASGQGSGSTAIDEFANDQGVNRGLNVAIRKNGDDPNNGGRQNTSFDADLNSGNFTNTNPSFDPHVTYLDSNDTNGIVWNARVANSDNGIAEDALFDRLLFTVTDPNDAGGTLTISASGFTETFTLNGNQDNGNIYNVLIGFSSKVDAAAVVLSKGVFNDGIGIDNTTIAAVPLPAAAWLLLGVSGALVAAKRRSAQRTA